MKYFGTVKSFDSDKGHGMIKPEAGGDELRFERSAISWGKENPPTSGQRLSYDVGQDNERQPCAVNLQTI
jgi:CspA family cold shock protein